MTTTYKQKDLEKLSVLATVIDAAHLWSLRCARYVQEHGDIGSCVIGAGIGVWMVKTGCRKAVEHTLIQVPYTASQGSFTWESSMPEVVKYLKDHGIDAHIIHGRLD